MRPANLVRVTTSLGEWLDRENERQLTLQRASLEGERVVASFVAAIAAGMASVALQQAVSMKLGLGVWGFVSLACLVGAVAAAISILSTDKLGGPRDADTVLKDQTLTPTQAINEVQVRTSIAISYNRDWLKDVKNLSRVQIVLGLISGTSSVLWLLSLA